MDVSEDPDLRELQSVSERVEDQPSPVYYRLFPQYLELIPGINELYELELAYLESQKLSKELLVRNGAYFAAVDGVPTYHYRMCRGDPLNVGDRASARLKAFFATNQFKTGYATHGLFPYRGKFHPQMIKALLNMAGLRPGDVVLDPMMGSGTVLIEATLMGISSIGFDASPFCALMTQAKLDGLKVPLEPLKRLLASYSETFEFLSRSGLAPLGRRSPLGQSKVDEYEPGANSSSTIDEDLRDSRLRNFVLLAYLDAIGYAQRSKNGKRADQFKTILERYCQAATKVQQFIDDSRLELASATPLVGDARKLDMPEEAVDGIAFSPPYSFAIDYVANDAYHLGFLGVNVPALKSAMVGLRGKDLREKVLNYEADMDQVLSECSRVLKPHRVCIIVVGTNDRQLSKALDLPPEKVESIPNLLSRLGRKHGLHEIRRIIRQVTGMANVMRSESILFLRRK